MKDSSLHLDLGLSGLAFFLPLLVLAFASSCPWALPSLTGRGPPRQGEREREGGKEGSSRCLGQGKLAKKVLQDALVKGSRAQREKAELRRGNFVAPEAPVEICALPPHHTSESAKMTRPQAKLKRKEEVSHV